MWKGRRYVWEKGAGNGFADLYRMWSQQLGGGVVRTMDWEILISFLTERCNHNSRSQLLYFILITPQSGCEDNVRNKTCHGRYLWLKGWKVGYKWNKSNLKITPLNSGIFQADSWCRSLRSALAYLSVRKVPCTVQGEQVTCSPYISVVSYIYGDGLILSQSQASVCGGGWFCEWEDPLEF